MKRSMKNTYIAYLENRRNGAVPHEGRGETRQEAIDACLVKITHLFSVYIEREDGIRIPEMEIEKAPTEMPAGCVLVVMVRSSHNSGYPYDWRYIAVPKGGSIRYPNGEMMKVEKATEISILDCNDDYEYGLPSGSFQFENGSWHPIERVGYTY